MEKEASPKKMDEWEIDSAMDTLVRAEEIKKDKKLMKAIYPKMKKKISSIEELKELYNDKMMDSEEEDDASEE